jgi:hypothetical protein
MQTTPEGIDRSRYRTNARLRRSATHQVAAPGRPPRRRWRTASKPSRKRCPVAVRFSLRLLHSRSRVRGCVR